MFHSSFSDDDLEGPEAIPDHTQRIKCDRVIHTNYSLLYGHLDTEKLLPKLPKSYLQRFAQNAIVIEALLRFDRPSHGLLMLCDTLVTTPGQENLGRKLLNGMMLT